MNTIELPQWDTVVWLPVLTVTLSNVDNTGPETTAYGLLADSINPANKG